MFDVKVLRDRVDLAALIERELGSPARREGRWLKWVCPFHADAKTPSLGVAGNLRGQHGLEGGQPVALPRVGRLPAAHRMAAAGALAGSWRHSG